MRLSILLAKYSLAGMVNTVVGYAVIFACMAGGLGPTLSNLLGYCVGFITSFVQSRHWVFRSRGAVVDDGLRFIPAFLVAFGVNFLVLQTMLGLGVDPYLAQFCACGAFVLVGFVLNYMFVFRKRDE
jgi:putative flippase GtrA